MGWVPVRSTVIKVEVLPGDFRNCRLQDQRDFDSILEFVSRCRFEGKEYSYVIDATQSGSQKNIKFVCLDSRGNRFPVHSPQTLALALHMPTLSNASELLTLRIDDCEGNEVQPTVSATPTIDDAVEEQIQEESQNFIDLLQTQDPTLIQQSQQLTTAVPPASSSIFYQDPVFEEAATAAPAGIIGPDSHHPLGHDANEGRQHLLSGSSLAHPTAATFANIGTATPDDPIHARAGTLPDDVFTRRSDLPQLKNYGHGSHSYMINAPEYVNDKLFGNDTASGEDCKHDIAEASSGPGLYQVSGRWVHPQEAAPVSNHTPNDL